jgi:hypothetical protein
VGLAVRTSALAFIAILLLLLWCRWPCFLAGTAQSVFLLQCGCLLPFNSVGLRDMCHLPINPHGGGEMQMKLSLMYLRHESNF